MSEISLAHFSFGSFDAADERNRFHDVALDEARVTTERIDQRVVAPAPAGFLSRLRLAVAGGPSITTDACNCPA